MFDDYDLLLEFISQDVQMEMSAPLKAKVKQRLMNNIATTNKDKIHDLKIARTANEYKATMAGRGMFVTKSDQEEIDKHNARAKKANQRINTQYNRRQRMLLRLKRDEDRQKGHFVPKINYYDNNRYHVKDSHYYASGVDPQHVR